MSTITRESAGCLPSGNVSFRESARTFSTVFETMASAIFICRGKFLSYANRAAEVITGYTREELVSMDFRDLLHLDFQDVMHNGSALRHEIKILTKDYQERWLNVTATEVDLDGVPGCLVSAFDFTDHKRVEESAQLLAVTDPLTGLGNYRCLLQVLDAEVKRFDRTDRPFAVLLLDLDDLKKVNDRYGHMVGSRALCRLGDVLRLHCRAIDTAARYGGDEFAVVLPETNAEAARIVACRIREQLAMDHEQPPLLVSIGVADYPEGGQTIEELLRTADRELYGIKNETGKALRFTSSRIEERACRKGTNPGTPHEKAGGSTMLERTQTNSGLLELDKAFQYAVTLAWQDFMSPIEPRAIRIEYLSEPGSPLDRLSVWSVRAGGYQDLVCDFQASASPTHPSGACFGNRHFSDKLAATLDLIMKNQGQFTRPADAGNHGLVVLYPPDANDRAEAAAWMNRAQPLGFEEARLHKQNAIVTEPVKAPAKTYAEKHFELRDAWPE